MQNRKPHQNIKGKEIGTNIIRKGNKTTNKANIPKQFPRYVWYTRGNKCMKSVSQSLS